jgi:hypothetical protein
LLKTVNASDLKNIEKEEFSLTVILMTTVLFERKWKKSVQGKKYVETKPLFALLQYLF